MFKSLNELEITINDNLNQYDFNSALLNVHDFVEGFLSHAPSRDVIFSSKKLDFLCEQIGLKALETMSSAESTPLTQVFQNRLNPNDSDLIVYLATILYETGGHTQVIEEFIEMQPNKNHLIILTDWGNCDHEKIIKRFAKYPVTIAACSGHQNEIKLKELISYLKTLEYSKIFLFTHHHDSVAISAVQALNLQNLYFYHHGDHNLTLGVHLKNAKHIDFHACGYYQCKKDGIQSPHIYLPLISKDQSRVKTDFLKNNRLVTCSVGSPNKFESSYKDSYPMLIPQMLLATGGQHIHIGYLGTQALNLIHDGIKDNHLPKDSFIHIPWVSSVWNTLIDHQVDLFITSFPYIGLKSTIEALGAGIPVITHENYFSRLLSGKFFVYEEALSWKKPQELLSILSSCDRSFLMTQSKLAREYYLQYHHPSLIQQQLDQSVIHGVCAPKEPLSFVPELFQIHLDEICRKHLLIKEHAEQLTSKEKRLIELQKNYHDALTHLNFMTQSLSWKITYPLRFLKKKLTSLIKKG